MIEHGWRLSGAGDRHNLYFGERMARRLNQLARRMPLRLRTRLSLKLMAVPKDPIEGDKVVGEALLAGYFLHGSEQIEVDALDFARDCLSPPLFDYLHSFAWLRDLAAAATRERGGRLAENIVRHWLDTCAVGQEDPSWRPDLWGRRILFWAAYAPYIHSSRDMAYRSALLNVFARGARFLHRRADQAPIGLARVTAWSGVMAAALLVKGGVIPLARAEIGLVRALDDALHEDGGLVSRSPDQQLALVELLGQLRAIYFAGRRHMPQRLQEALSGSVAALLGATLGDDALSSWQGGNMLSRRRLAAAIKGARVATPPLCQPNGWGYQRLTAGSAVVIFDGAPPPAVGAFAGSCASTLAFEFSDGLARIVVNCGGLGRWYGARSVELVHALRFTAAHSTLTLDDRNSTAVLEDGLLGKGVRQVEVVREDSTDIARIKGSHDGYVRRFGLLHLRGLMLAGDGRELRGEDHLIVRKRQRDEPIPFAVRFHLGPSVEVAAIGDRQHALLRVPGGHTWHFECRGGSLDIEDSLWIDGSGRPRGTAQLVISGETPPDGIAIHWLFQRAS